jgi:type 1 fimbria pilin
MDQATQDRPTITMDSVDSSQINAIGYDAATQTLAIQLKNFNGNVGSTYHYANFTPTDWDAFKAAESKGSHFGKFIKKEAVKYPYIKVS